MESPKLKPGSLNHKTKYLIKNISYLSHIIVEQRPMNQGLNA